MLRPRERRIFELLIEHDIIQMCLLPEAAADPSDAGMIDLSLILDALIPRLVFFDAECIYEETKYAELLRAFALATQGEWVIEDASSTFLLGERFREFGAQITFKTQGRRPIWTFEQSSKWVQGAFYDRVNAFTVRRFGKVFLQLPTYDQCYCGVYLARAAADALEAIFAADEAAHADEVRRRYRVLWYA